MPPTVSDGEEARLDFRGHGKQADHAAHVVAPARHPVSYVNAPLSWTFSQTASHCGFVSHSRRAPFWQASAQEAPGIGVGTGAGGGGTDAHPASASAAPITSAAKINALSVARIRTP